MADRVAEQLFNGNDIPDGHTREVSLRCQIMKDIEELEASNINEFYQLETPEEKETDNGKA